MENKTVCTSCEIPILKVFAIDTEAGDFCPECCGQDAHHMSLDDMLDLSGATHIRAAKGRSENFPYEVCLSTGTLIAQKHYTGMGKTCGKAFNIAYQRMILRGEDGRFLNLPCDDLPATLDEFIDQKNTASLKDHLINAALSRGQA